MENKCSISFYISNFWDHPCTITTSLFEILLILDYAFILALHVPSPDHTFSSTRKNKWSHSFKTLVFIVWGLKIILRGRISKMKSVLSVWKKLFLVCFLQHEESPLKDIVLYININHKNDEYVTMNITPQEIMSRVEYCFWI